MSDKSELVECSTCGGERNHTVLAAHTEQWSATDDVDPGHEVYQIVKCNGCDTVRFAIRKRDMMRADFGVPDTIEVFPRQASDGERQPALAVFDLPDDVWNMYHETHAALNADALILAGAGLRAIVEALCLEQGVTGKLHQQIDKLVSKGLLAKAQADALHEERYLGNAAIHEMKKPTKKDLDDGLHIVESLLRTIYILPVHAERLRKKREARNAAKKKTTEGAKLPNAALGAAQAKPPPQSPKTKK